MPITNVQSCRAGHAEYPHLNLPHFLIDRQAPLMVGLLVVGVAPRLLGLSAGWRALSLGWAASTALVILWFTATLTLINPNACFLYSNETLIEQPAEIGYLTLRHTRQATAFIAEAAAAPRPWFLYLSYPNAHTALFAMDENRGRSAHGLYGDNVEEMDWSVGEVLAALDASGERDDTIVYFASDNGPFREELEEGGSCGYAPVLSPSTPRVGAIADAPARATTQLRGAKGQTWECGVRVPGILSYPARWAGGRVAHEATSVMDVLPTIVELVDASGAIGTRLRHISELGG